jgi:Chaperone of endosialidase
MANIYRFRNQSVAFENTITSTISSGTNLTIANSSSSSGIPLTVFQGSLTTSAKTQLKLGVAATTNNTGILQFNYTGNASTSNSLGIGLEGSENLLQISGTTISSVLPITNTISTGTNLTLTNNASSTQGLFRAYQPNLANTNYTFKAFGVSEVLRNAATQKFVYTSTGSTSNYYGLGLWSQDDILVINGNQRVGINNTAPSFTLDVTGTIRATGLISANLGLTVTGANTSVTTLSCSGLISANLGLTVTGATTSVTTLSCSGLISANLGLTVTGATTSVTTLSSSDLISANNGLTVTGVGSLSATPTGLGVFIGLDANGPGNAGIQLNSATPYIDFSSVITANDFDARIILTNSGATLSLQCTNVAVTGALSSSGLVSANSGLTVTGANTSVTTLSSSGLISANLGLTVTGATTSVTSLTASGLITASAGLTSTAGTTTLGTTTVSNSSGTPLALSSTSSGNTDIITFTSTVGSLPNGYRNNMVVGKAFSLNDSATYRYFYTSSGSTSNYTTIGFFGNDDILTVAATKNVGIGTTNPQSALHVAGLIPATPTGRGVHIGVDSLLNGNSAIQLNGDTPYIDFSSVITANDFHARIILTSSTTLSVQPSGTTFAVAGLISANLGLTVTGATTSVTSLTASALISANLGLTVTGANTSVTTLSSSGLITASAGLTSTAGATTLGTTTIGLTTVNPVVVDRNSFDHSTSPVTITNNTPTTTSGPTLSGVLPVLHLCRQGAGGLAFGARATFDLSRYEIAGTGGFGSRTQMNISLTNDQYDAVNVMSMRSNGNIGINNTVPARVLDVVDPATTPGSISASIFAPNMSTSTFVSMAIGKSTGASTTNCAVITYSYVGNNNSANYWKIGHNNSLNGYINSTSGGDISVGSNNFTIPSGNVGIGTSSPGVPLDVSGSVNLSNGGSHGYLVSTGSGVFSGSTNVPVSIRASARMTASEFDVFSDRRIKTNISNISDSLIMLRKITPRNFNYIDKFSKGDKIKFGFIGQELILVDKNLASYSKDYIPNIYQKCVVTNNIIVCRNAINFDLKGNGNIKLFDIDNKEKIVTLKSKISDYSFNINETLENKEYFVLGEEVDDFHIIDEAGITALTTAAVKELDIIVIEQQTTIQNQQQKIELLENFIKAKFPGEF